MAQGMDAIKEQASHMQNYLAQQIAEENKMCHGMPGMAVKTPSGNFTPHHEQPQQQQSEEPSPLEIDGKWTPRMLAVLSGKPQDLMTVHPDSQLNRITQRAVKKFEKLRTLAGDDVAMLVARQPEVVMLIERVEAKEHDGVVPKYTIASCAQAAADVLLEVEEAAAMSYMFAN